MDVSPTLHGGIYLLPPSDSPVHLVAIDTITSYYSYEISPSTANDTQEDTDTHTASIVWLVLVPFIVGTITIVTVIGNALVVVAYWKDRRIHNRVANLLIVNLAISDFVVGLLILSVNLAWITWNEVLGGPNWLLGETFCKIWIVIDNTVVMVSVCTIILISLDRYWLLTKKLKYQRFQTRKRVIVSIAVLWVVNTGVYTFLTFGWTLMTGEAEVDYSEECELELSYNVYATTALLLIEFIIPLTIIICLNVIVYVKIRKRAQGLNNKNFVESTPTPRSLQNSKDVVLIESEKQSSGSSGSALSASSSTLVLRSKYLQDTPNTSEETIHESSFTTINDSRNYNTIHHNPAAEQTTSPSAVKVSTNQKAGREFARERRAAFVLGVLVSVFVACWLPFHIVSIINAICGDDCVSEVTWEIVNNLLWCNSFVNPFLYAATNVHFRRNFIVFLRLSRLPCVQTTITISRRSSTMDNSG